MKTSVFIIGVLIALIGSGYALLMVNQSVGLIKTFEPKYIDVETSELERLDRATLAYALNNAINKSKEDKSIWVGIIEVHSEMVKLLIVLLIIEVLLIGLVWKIKT